MVTRAVQQCVCLSLYIIIMTRRHIFPCTADRYDTLFVSRLRPATRQQLLQQYDTSRHGWMDGRMDRCAGIPRELCHVIDAGLTSTHELGNVFQQPQGNETEFEIFIHGNDSRKHNKTHGKRTMKRKNRKILI